MPKFDRPPRRNGGPPERRPSSELITVAQCHVCQSKDRHSIEKMLALGTSYSEIERAFGIGRRPISTHDKKHLNLESAAIRQIIEREAQAADMNIEEGIKGVVARRVYLETGLHKALEALIKNETIVEPKDAVAIIDKLDKLDGESQEAAIDELRIQFQAYLQAMKEVVPGDMWERIAGRTRELLTISNVEKRLGKGPDISK